VRIALAQVDSRVGDLGANAERAREAVAEARAGGADLVVFPELQLSGYGVDAGADASCSAAEAAALADGVAVVAGFAERDGEQRYNSAVYAEDGVAVHVQRKVHLVDYPPWDEDADFVPGDTLSAFDRKAMLICNDAWQPLLPVLAVQAGAELLLVPSASTTAMPGVDEYWRGITTFYARMLQCYVVFVNRVGRDGAFTFWGGSHVVDPLGEVVAEAPRFEESVLLVDIDLDRVAARRRELPLVAALRPELLRAELERLTARA
jgi:predicted amidohydrolase